MSLLFFLVIVFLIGLVILIKKEKPWLAGLWALLGGVGLGLFFFLVVIFGIFGWFWRHI